MSSESDVTRRDFLKTAAKTTAGASAFTGLTFLTRPERVFGANDRVRVAVCGLRSRRKDHLDAFARVPNVEIAALCDIDEAVLTQPVGRTPARARRREVPPHRATRHAEPLGSRADRGDRPPAQRHLRRDLSGAGALL